MLCDNVALADVCERNVCQDFNIFIQQILLLIQGLTEANRFK